MTFADVAAALREVPPAIGERLETEIKMAGYVGRQEAAIARAAADEANLVPGDFDYRAVAALSLEARDKLSRIRPRTLGAAGRVPGITPADLAVLSVVLHRRAETRTPVAGGLRWRATTRRSRRRCTRPASRTTLPSGSRRTARCCSRRTAGST